MKENCELAVSAVRVKDTNIQDKHFRSLKCLQLSGMSQRYVFNPVLWEGNGMLRHGVEAMKTPSV